MRYFLISIILALLLKSAAQAQLINTATMDTIKTNTIGPVAFGGYVDAYYGYNFSQPANGRNPYFVSSSRHNEVNINLAYLDVRFRTNNLRARLVPGFGTYMNANYSHEPSTLKNIVEGRVGVRILPKHEVWLDVGVLGSPYTNESAISKDHLMYTRSFAPENVPYYLTGAKLTVPLSEKVTTYLYFLNGWQVIQDNNKGKAVGTQVEFRPNDKMLFNWNTYAGNENSNQHPDFQGRYFTDFYWIFKPSKKFDATSCFYIGVQKKTNASNESWWQANFIGRYHFTEKISLSGRVEYFSDPGMVFQTPVTGVSSFRAFSTGLCGNLMINSNAMFRVEARQFLSPDNIYYNAENQPVASSALLIGSLTVWF